MTTLVPTTTTTLPSTTTTHPAPPGYVMTSTDVQVSGVVLGTALGIIVGGTVFASLYRDSES